MNEVCTDNRFKLIEKYKNRLIKGTNIKTNKAEMEVLDNILFRLWQMGWLDILENYEKEKECIVDKLIDAYEKAYVKSKIIDTPRETLIRWDGHKEGISEAINIVKGMEE